jgi:DNA-nicking Smr family endonuclease
MENNGYIELPVDGTLDLHYFSPREVSSLVPDYLQACMEKGIFQVRIVHGKGTGILRGRVHSILKDLEYVEAFSLAGDGAGGWGATVVKLKTDTGHDETV